VVGAVVVHVDEVVAGVAEDARDVGVDQDAGGAVALSVLHHPDPQVQRVGQQPRERLARACSPSLLPVLYRVPDGSELQVIERAVKEAADQLPVQPKGLQLGERDGHTAVVQVIQHALSTQPLHLLPRARLRLLPDGRDVRPGPGGQLGHPMLQVRAADPRCDVIHETLPDLQHHRLRQISPVSAEVGENQPA